MTKFFLGFLVPFSVLLPICMGIFHFRKFPYQLRVIVVYAIISGIANLIGSIFASHGVNNMPISHVFTVLEFVLCSLFYRKALNGTAVQLAVVPLICFFIVLSIVSAIYWQGIFVFNSYTRSFETITFIIYGLALYYKLLGMDMSMSKQHFSKIWINTGLVLYFSGSLFLFIFPEFLHAPPWVYDVGWIMHASLVMLMYLLFSMAFVKYKQFNE